MLRIYSTLLQLWFICTAFFKKRLVTHTAPSIFAIDYARMKQSGIRAIIFDLDDTLATWYTPITDDVIALLTSIEKDYGMSVAILTNASSNRAERSKHRLASHNVYFVSDTPKPLKQSFAHMCTTLDVSPSQVAAIGDRLGTDMWGAQRANIAMRILVGPYSKISQKNDSPLIQKIVRALEQCTYVYGFTHRNTVSSISKKDTLDPPVSS